MNPGTMVSLLYAIREELEDALKDCRLHYKQDEGQNATRGLQYFLQIPPLPEDESEAVPFVMLQLVAGEDSWSDTKNRETCTATVRIILETYNRNPVEGKLELIGLVEKIRLRLKQKWQLPGCFQCVDPFEYLIYPDDTDVFHAAELSTNWLIPGVEREKIVPKFW